MSKVSSTRTKSYSAEIHFSSKKAVSLCGKIHAEAYFVMSIPQHETSVSLMETRSMLKILNREIARGLENQKFSR